MGTLRNGNRSITERKTDGGTLATPFHTRLCDLLGLKYPIIQGALGGVGGPALVAAVSNAGGLGVLQTWGLTLEKLRSSIRETRKLTSLPFAVNITPISQNFTVTRAELVVDEGVEIVTTGRGDPRRPIVSFLKSQGRKVIGVVPTVRHALRLENEGVDAIVASGSEAGGHVGKVSTLPLVPQVVDAVKVPVVAAGGISDHRGFVAALALGASGIQMGTRFVATTECYASSEQKERILEAIDEDSIVTDLFTGKPVRVLRSLELDRLVHALETGSSRKELRSQITELRRKRRKGSEGFISIASGQGAGLINEILPAKDLIEQIISDALILCSHLDPWSLTV
jgi:enoyl-[acyl-carrier protein] reductase II